MLARQRRAARAAVEWRSSLLLAMLALVSAALAATNGGPPPPPPPPAHCNNFHQHCNFWASSGECTKNPSWMEPNCALACHKCASLPQPELATVTHVQQPIAGAAPTATAAAAAGSAGNLPHIHCPRPQLVESRSKSEPTILQSHPNCRQQTFAVKLKSVGLQFERASHRRALSIEKSPSSSSAQTRRSLTTAAEIGVSTRSFELQTARAIMSPTIRCS